MSLHRLIFSATIISKFGHFPAVHFHSPSCVCVCVAPKQLPFPNFCHVCAHMDECLQGKIQIKLLLFPFTLHLVLYQSLISYMWFQSLPLITLAEATSALPPLNRSAEHYSARLLFNLWNCLFLQNPQLILTLLKISLWGVWNCPISFVSLNNAI